MSFCGTQKLPPDCIQVHRGPSKEPQALRFGGVGGGWGRGAGSCAVVVCSWVVVDVAFRVWC